MSWPSSMGCASPIPSIPDRSLSVRGTTRTAVLQAQPQQTGSSAQPTAPTRRASPPPRASAANAPSFQWPLQGQIITAYGGAEGARIDGIRIAARLGDPVRAAADGEVVYAGNELQGYGELVLVRHENNWVTAYGLNSVLRVNVGDRVTAGQHIADAGARDLKPAQRSISRCVVVSARSIPCRFCRPARAFLSKSGEDVPSGLVACGAHPDIFRQP